MLLECGAKGTSEGEVGCEAGTIKKPEIEGSDAMKYINEQTEREA